MKKVFAIAVMAVIPTFAANGTGIWFDVGASKVGPSSKEMDTLVAGQIYDSYFDDNTGNSFSQKVMRDAHTNGTVFQPMMSPSFTAGFEKSFNRALSASAGLGLRMAASNYLIEQTESSHAFDVDGNLLSQSNNNVKVEVANSFTNLVVPIEMKAMVPTRSGGIYLSGGPELVFLLGAKNSYDVSFTETTSENKSTETDVKDKYKGFSFGLGWKLGGEINVKQHNILIETGYTAGLTNISKDEKITMKNGEFTLLQLGFRFNTEKMEKKTVAAK